MFDTRKRPQTKFGLETKNEMCVNFIVFYPVQRRSPTDASFFNCAGVFESGKDSNTICGDPFKPSAYSAQRNPTFDDDTRTPEIFGRKQTQCSVAAPVKKPVAAPVKKPGRTRSTPECFPAPAVVHTRRGQVEMRALRVGDEVAVGGGAFSRVFMFTHRVAEGRFRFVELRTRSARIALSAGHYIYAAGSLKAAGDVRVGDSLRLADGTEERVRSARWVKEKGLYNPQTEQGDIVVNGVVASTYTEAVPPKAAHALLTPARALKWRLAVLESESNFGEWVRRLLAQWSF